MKIISILVWCVVLFGGCGAETHLGYPEEGYDTGVTVQAQEAPNWCWAATTQAFEGWLGVSRTQTEIVSERFGRECTPQTCDAPHQFRLVSGKGRFLTGTKNRVLARHYKILLSHDIPIVLEKLYDGGGAHFLVLAGYDAEGKFIVRDPAFGREYHQTYEEMINPYHDRTWKIQSSAMTWFDPTNPQMPEDGAMLTEWFQTEVAY